MNTLGSGKIRIAITSALMIVVTYGTGHHSLNAESLPASQPSDMITGSEMAPPESLAKEWKPLLDDHLTQWELWMGVPRASVKDLPEGTPRSDDSRKVIPLGLNNDPKHVFSIMMDSGEPVLHITGEIFGGLTTLKSFSNYHFRCQFRWGDHVWAPKLDKPKDNGILYHCTGRHGAFWNVWKRSVEFQVEDQNNGDLYLLAGTMADVPVTPVPGEKNMAYDPGGKLSHAGNRTLHLPGKFESPMGEWNNLDLYTLGRTSVAVVNGHVVMVLRNIAIKAPPGSNASSIPLSSGQIQLQSEGAEAFYRRVEIQSISEYPPEIQKEAKFSVDDLKMAFVTTTTEGDIAQKPAAR